MIWGVVGAVTAGIVVWFFTEKNAQISRQLEKLQEERLKIYEAAIDPFVQAVSASVDKKRSGSLNSEILKYVTSSNYMRVRIKLCLIGSDEVVRAMNELQNASSNNTLQRYGELLLAIKKDLMRRKLPKNTKLDSKDMLMSFITDIDKAY